MGNDINDLKAAIVALRSEIKLISERVNSSNTSLSNAEFEEVVQEVFERQNRKCNIIIFGLKEQDGLKGDKLASEKADVVKVVTHISQAVTVTDIRRIGKYDPSRPATKPRPIKVSLPSAEQVLELIKKSPALKNSEEFKNISVSYDRTPRQMQLYKEVRKQLDDRKNGGESNIRIKYVNGIPKIVNF
nr:unnamed protein product [Callosobruchus analis]